MTRENGDGPFVHSLGLVCRERVGKAVLFAIICVAGGLAMTGRAIEAAARPPGFRSPRLLAANPAPPVIVQAFSVTGGTPSSSDNDYTRINNAVQAASGGTAIQLEGTFAWTETNAAASWALGSDGMAATADDYSITVPAGLNNLTITASSLGTATVEGPGDLATVDLEAFLVCLDGDNQDFEVSNLRIRNFDLSIGMFVDKGRTAAFNGTRIQDNYILIPADLNAAVAPSDDFQNIGIHFSFGANQTISGNTIEVAGNGVSDTPNNQFAASVGMQSNTSGGNVYDGLSIDNNTIRVLNAQSADPEVILGIWENGHAHSSNITVSNNHFINAAAGNDPSLNLQSAFRVTSHSSATTTVAYSTNTADGANRGFEWIASSNFAGNQAVEMTSNTLTNCLTGVLIRSNGIAHLTNNQLTGIGGSGTGVSVEAGSNATVDAASGPNRLSGFDKAIDANGSATIDGNAITGNTTAVNVGSTGTASMSFNRIVGNGSGVTSAAAAAINAENNWWGCNAGPGGGGCDSTAGNVDFNPWLVLGLSSAPASILPTQTSTVTATLVVNSDGVDTSASGHVPDGTTVAFGGGAPLGSIAPPSAATTSAGAQATFLAGTLPGLATVSATVDAQTVFTNITITGGPTTLCLQDDSTHSFLVFDRATGDYMFHNCVNGLTLTGKGSVSVVGCSTKLVHNAADRRITATIDSCRKKGSASIQTFSPKALVTITDRNTANDTCACP